MYRDSLDIQVIQRSYKRPVRPDVQQDGPECGAAGHGCRRPPPQRYALSAQAGSLGLWIRFAWRFACPDSPAPFIMLPLVVAAACGEVTEPETFGSIEGRIVACRGHHLC